MSREASWTEALDGGRVRCLLCPKGCVIPDGGSGACLGRVNRGGVLYAETYEKPTSIAVDPIEKKPLYHFLPGSEILSLGTYGCNLTCSFCQNWSISQQVTETRYLTVDEAVKILKSRNSIGIAYTYNEPTVWAEYVLDCAKTVKAQGMKNVLVTNGYINEAPLDELLDLVDALNVDIKAFDDKFYRDLCGGSLAPVLDRAVQAKKKAHVEITNLVIPGYNDSEKEQRNLARWIAENLGDDTPVHLSAYFPRHKLQAAPTPVSALHSARDIFKDVLSFVYLGNVRDKGAGDTICPACGARVVARDGYSISTRGLTANGACAVCGCGLNFVMQGE